MANGSVCLLPLGTVLCRGLFKYAAVRDSLPNRGQLQTHSECLFPLQLALTLCPEYSSSAPLPLWPAPLAPGWPCLTVPLGSRTQRHFLNHTGSW